MPIPLSAAVLADATRRAASDWLLGSLGISAAAVSASFAVYMVAVGPGTTGARGHGDFDVFVQYDRRARPVTATEVRPPIAAPPSPLAHGLALAPPPSDIDFTPTGSIVADRGDAPGDAPPPPAGSPRGPSSPHRLDDYVIRDVFDGKAVIEFRNKLHLVEPGSVIEGVGEVLAVRRTEGGWAVDTASGMIAK